MHAIDLAVGWGVAAVVWLMVVLFLLGVCAAVKAIFFD